MVPFGSSCSGSVEAFVPPPDESYPAAVVARGEDIHGRTCATCHGRDGGGGVGPDIRQVWERLSYEQHLEVVTAGRNAMPAFGRSLSAEDIEAVVAYQRTGWGDPGA